MESLSTFIKSQISIDDSLLEAILLNFKLRKIAKGKHVLKAGQIARDYFFVDSGALRIYFTNKDKQITAWMALKNEFFTDLSSLKYQTPSRFNIQAVEDTVLYTIEHREMEALYKQYPQWQTFGRQVWENAFLKVIDGILMFQTMTAEERYLTAMQQSDLLQQLPLKDLSTFLGITPTSLSRIRKNFK